MMAVMPVNPRSMVEKLLPCSCDGGGHHESYCAKELVGVITAAIEARDYMWSAKIDTFIDSARDQQAVIDRLRDTVH